MLSFIIPVYRSAASLKELYNRISTTFEAENKDFEVIFVEDCGGDNSWEVIQQLTILDPRVRGLRLSRNYGQHNALLCGIREARGQIIVTLDDDLQHPPEEFPKLLARLDEGFDVVYGPPVMEQHGFGRDLASRITKIAMAGTLGTHHATQVSALRAFRTPLREAFEKFNGPTVNIDVLLSWATSNFGTVRVHHAPRQFGHSGYTTVKLLQHALNMMTGFSTRPLQVASFLGFSFAIFGLCVLGFVIVRWFLQGSTVPGFAFLASAIAVFSGAQLIALGIIGEYLAGMHGRTMERPTYLVREKARLEDFADSSKGHSSGYPQA